MLSFQSHEAKTNGDVSFSQFSRNFSNHTIAHCIFMVSPIAFIFSGIVRIIENFISDFWNFQISATRWCWLRLFTFLFWLILYMLHPGFLWFLCMRSSIYLQRCREKIENRGNSVLGFYLRFFNFDLLGIMLDLVSEAW